MRDIFLIYSIVLVVHSSYIEMEETEIVFFNGGKK